MQPVFLCANGSICGGVGDSNNRPPVSLHTADPYVVANDSVKHQGKPSPGLPGALLPPEPLSASVRGHCYSLGYRERTVLAYSGLMG